jgi:hypothetical protein
MPLSTDMLRTWRCPRRVIRGLMEQGPREDRLILLAMIGCFLMFIAQLPVQARISFLSRQGRGEHLELDMLIGTAFFGWMMIMPLVLYLVAGLSVAVMRLFRRRISGHDARLALFWAVLAAAPAALLMGLSNGLTGPGAGTTAAGVIWLGALALFWVQGLREAGTAVAGRPA